MFSDENNKEYLNLYAILFHTYRGSPHIILDARIIVYSTRIICSTTKTRVMAIEDENDTLAFYCG